MRDGGGAEVPPVGGGLGRVRDGGRHELPGVEPGPLRRERLLGLGAGLGLEHRAPAGAERRGAVGLLGHGAVVAHAVGAQVRRELRVRLLHVRGHLVAQHDGRLAALRGGRLAVEHDVGRGVVGLRHLVVEGDRLGGGRLVGREDVVAHVAARRRGPLHGPRFQAEAAANVAEALRAGDGEAAEQHRPVRQAGLQKHLPVLRHPRRQRLLSGEGRQFRGGPQDQGELAAVATAVALLPGRRELAHLALHAVQLLHELDEVAHAGVLVQVVDQRDRRRGGAVGAALRPEEGIRPPNEGKLQARRRSERATAR